MNVGPDNGGKLAREFSVGGVFLGQIMRQRLDGTGPDGYRGAYLLFQHKTIFHGNRENEVGLISEDFRGRFGECGDFHPEAIVFEVADEFHIIGIAGEDDDGIHF